MAHPPPPDARARPPAAAASASASAPPSVPTPVPVPVPVPTPLTAPRTMPPPLTPAPAPAPRAPAPPAPGAGALQEETLATFLRRVDMRLQTSLDRVAPYKLERWLSLLALLLVFMLRMILLEGFYIVTYVLFIFILNQFILFLQPKDRASLRRNADAAAATAAASGGAASAPAEEDPAEKAPALPLMDDEEFRPFVRRLPEFQFWYSTTCATILAFAATFFKVFDVPVFWPVLLFYFILLFATTMRRQWLDMKRFKYVPWDIGSKKVYKSDPKRVSVTRTERPTDVVAASGRAPPAPVPTVNVKTKKPTSMPPAEKVAQH